MSYAKVRWVKMNDTWVLSCPFGLYLPDIDKANIFFLNKMDGE